MRGLNFVDNNIINFHGKFIAFFYSSGRQITDFLIPLRVCMCQKFSLIFVVIINYLSKNISIFKLLYKF